MKRSFYIITFGLISIFSGCSLHEDTPLPRHLPTSPSVTPPAAPGANPPSTPQAAYHDPGKWWQLFKQRGLDDWMGKAISKNPSILMAQARIEQRLATSDKAWSSLFPNLNLSASNSQTITGTGDTQVSAASLSMSLESSYDLDLFGANSSNLKASELDLLSAVEDYKLNLANTSGTVAKAWFSYHESSEQLALAKTSLEADQANYEWIKESYRRGQGQAVNVLVANEQVLGSRLQILSLETQKEQNVNLLHQLTGQYPTTFGEGGKLPELVDLPTAPDSFSTRRLTKRPAVAKAIINIKAQDHRIAAAVAARFPRLSISASTGTSASQVSGLSDTANLFSNLAGNLTLPILDMGGRRAEVRRAEKVLQELLANYKNSLLQAYADVQNAMSRAKHSRLKVEILKEQIQLSKDRLALTKTGFIKGLILWDQVITSQQQVYNYQKSYLTERRLWAEARIDLFISLGGNWEASYFKQAHAPLHSEIKENP
ncbi:MAG: TolC family protein [SAR324 cluster bacterium]|nr:TolC family protein [SAR324 cluster bacterium]